MNAALFVRRFFPKLGILAGFFVCMGAARPVDVTETKKKTDTHGRVERSKPSCTLNDIG
jgi:hypothetical protein